MKRQWLTWVFAFGLISSCTSSPADTSPSHLTTSTTPVPVGPYDLTATVESDLIVVHPDDPMPGESVSVFFPDERIRGIHYVLESRTGDGWYLEFHLISDWGGSEQPTFSSAEDEPVIDVVDVGIGGPGPDRVIIPPETLFGDYRICTANSRPNICARLVVDEDSPEPTISETTTQALFDTGFGTPERVCVDVDEIVANEEPLIRGEGDSAVSVFDVRSGDFVAGNFDSVVDEWATWPGGNMKVYWVPFDHITARTGSLEVVVEPLDPVAAPVTLTFEQTASTASGVFWPTGTVFPHPGRYRLTATAPGHWGCFEVTV